MINFSGHIFEPQLCGALYWRARKTLIVSDLHFEKGSSYAKFGSFVPPFDTSETLQKLQKTLDDLKPKTILFLGDIYHDGHSQFRMHKKDFDHFNQIINSYKIIWIEGNHDPDTAPKNVINHIEFEVEHIMFRHIATSNPDFEMSGHYHPCIKFSHKEQKIRRPCFVVTNNKIIMPAYGAYTGGLDIKNEAYNNIIDRNTILYIIGHNNIHPVKFKN